MEHHETSDTAVTAGHRESITGQSIAASEGTNVNLVVSICYTRKPDDREMTRLYHFEKQLDLLLAAAKELAWRKSTVQKYSGEMGLQYFYYQLCVQIFEKTLNKDLKRVLSVHVLLSPEGRVVVETKLQESSGTLYPCTFSVPGKIRFHELSAAHDAEYLPGELGHLTQVLWLI